MVRYIDADKLCKNLKDMAKYQEPYKQATILGVVSTIENTPTADVVEIPCRCNECKSFVENKEALVTYCTRECKNLTVKPSDFCSYGKRK